MGLIQSLFSEKFLTHADRVALQCGSSIVTYRDLDKRSSAIAAFLLGEYGNEQRMISLYLEDRMEMIIAMIGVLRARQIFVPIDTSLPAKRIAHMFETTGPEIVITDTIGKEKLHSPGNKLVDTILFNAIVEDHESPVSLPAYNEEDAIYVYFTSGSTGKPKAITGINKSLAHFINWEIKTFQLNDSVRVSQLINPGFDASLRDIFVALGSGGVLCIPPSREVQLHPGKLVDWLSSQSVHLVHCVPSLFRLINDGIEAKESLVSLKYILLSGEKIQPADLKVWYDKMEDRVQLVNLYGTTETTLIKTFYHIEPKDTARDIIPVGKAISDTEILLLDKDLRKADEGSDAEVYIRTAFHTQGYLNDEALTAQRFIQNPFSKDASDLIYKTGDRGRIDADGNLLVLGRIDRQVKVRGVRIDPEEIELLLLDHPGVKEAVVTARKLKGDEQELCAYATGDKNLSPAILRKHLADRVPEYMLPSSFIILDAFPLTPNGKTDIHSLPEPSVAISEEVSGTLNETEQRLALLWAGVLETDVKNIGTQTNFFEAGGHSLRVAILASHIEKEFSIEMPLLEIFNYPLLVDIAAYIQRAEQTQENTIPKAADKPLYQLSSGQERVCFLQQYSPASTAYNISTLFNVHGRLDVDRLQKAFEQVVARHESLRTGFEIVNGIFWQRILDTVPFSIHYAEYNGEDHDALIKDFIQPFDMSKAPLMRVGVFKMKEDDFVLIVDVHHSVADGTSLVILVKEMLSFYQGESREAIHIQYRDYSEWRHANSGNERMEAQRKFWVEKFRDEIPVLELPLDYPRPARLNLEGRSVRFLIRKQTIDALKRHALQQDTTLYTVLLTCYLVMLNRLTSQRTIVIGTIIAGRRHADLSDTMGMFANTLAMKFTIDPGMTLQQLLAHVKQQVLDAFANQDYDYEDLIKEVVKTRDASRSPLFDAMFNLQNMDIPEIALPGIRFRRFDIEKGISKFDLTLRGIEEEGRFEFTYEYNTHLFSSSTIDRFIYYINHILEEITAAPNRVLGQVDMRTPGEMKVFQKETAAAIQPYSTQKIHELFEKQVDAKPSIPALKYKSEIYSYKELDERANKIANALRTQGVAKGSIVALLLPRCPETIIAMLGILKAGAAFLPIERAYPDPRKQHLLSDSKATLLLTDKETYTSQDDFFCSVAVPVFCMDDNRWWNEESSERLATSEQNESPAYVIYTSGTTGLPKGVVINHSSIVNYISWSIENYVKVKPAVMPFFTSYSFDLTLTSVFVPLLSGNTTIIYPSDGEDSLLLEKIFKEDEVTIIKLTPAHLKIAANCATMPKKLEAMIVGGEMLGYQSALSIHERSAGRIAVFNEYGPTENTVGCIVHRFDPADEYDAVPIGRPVTNTYAYILNESLQPVPDGVSGELYLGGIQVAAGYLGDDKRTAEKFLPDPFSGKGMMYRSGDIARRLPGNIIMYLGRTDDQVKIAGHRIELAEIENHLLAFNGIMSASAIVNENADGDKYIIACFVGEAGISVSMIKDYMGKALPAYMQPYQYLHLDEIPLTGNGKVNRKAIIELLAQNTVSSLPGQVIESEIAEELCVIWSEVLSVPKNEIVADADFFRLGGHSLAAISLLSRIIKKWNVPLSLGDVFDAAAFNKQLAIIEELTGSQKQTETRLPPVVPSAIQDHYPLSSAQRRLFILHQLSPHSVVYNTPLVYIAEGKVDMVKLEEVFRTLVHRHDSFRTSFSLLDGIPVQTVAGVVDFHLSVLPKQDVSAAISQFVQPFALDETPLLRVGLMKMESNRWLLMIDTHHIISDEVSAGILLREFVALYNGELPAQPSLQFRDVVMWQQDPVCQDHIARQKDFWMQQLAGDLPRLALPADYPRPSVKSFEGDTITFKLGRQETERLKQFAEEERVTLYMVLLSVYNILIARLSGQEDIITGTISAGRNQKDLQDVHGIFVNTLALRTYPKDRTPYRDFLKEIKKTTLACFDNQDYQYEDLVEAIGVERDTSSNPLFEVMFNMHHLAQEKLNLTGLKLLPYPWHTRTTKFDLNLQVTEVENELVCNLSYATAIFRRSTAERFATGYQALVEQVLANPSQRLAHLTPLPAAEINRIVCSFNDTQKAYDGQQLIHRLFEQQVINNPSAIALLDPGHVVTYEELNQSANRLARTLMKEGIGAGKFVSVTLERSPEMIIAVMAILKTGAAYVPAEPYLPTGRIKTIVESLAIPVAITDLQNLSKVAACTHGLKCVKTVVCLEEMAGLNGYLSNDCHWKLVTPETIDTELAINPDLPLSSESLAYVIFTSGSTGAPKGVAVKHKPVINLIEWVNREYNVGANDKLLFTTSLAFDLSVYDIFGILAAGGTVRIATREELQEPESLVDCMIEEDITFWDSAPASLLQLVPYMKRAVSEETALRLVFLSGDWVPLTLPDAVRQAFTRAKVIALGGATEATVWSNYFPVGDIDVAWRSIPYGKPIQNAAYYILDKNYNVCPIGVKGDLYIGGECLASGYINDADLTARKFIPDPFRKGGTMYYTGDKARWFEDGNIEFLGREDSQVKIRGYRIELGEIEHQLLKYPGVETVKVIVRQAAGGNHYLVAYYVNGAAIEEISLRSHLSSQLPEYMIPAYFVHLDQMPVTVNGKLDTKALPDPIVSTDSLYSAPLNETESIIIDIWAQVLKQPKDTIGREADFFRLGGHSLTATFMLAQVHQKLDVKVPLIELFKRPMLRDLADYIEQAYKDIYRPITVAPKQDHYPVSPAQKRMFSLQYLMPELNAYNIPVAFELEGRVDVAKIEQRFRALINRHETLRTSFKLVDNEPVQQVHVSVPFELERLKATRKTIDQVIASFIRPFDLEQAPLFRVALIESGERKKWLVLDMHHIISDGNTVDILLRDFMNLYNEEPLTEQALQYKDYTCWYQHPANKAMMQTQANYWLNQFNAGVPDLQLPLDYPREGYMNFEGDIVRFTVNSKTDEYLHQLAEREGATLYMILLAAFNVLLAKWSGDEDIVTGSPVTGRRYSGMEQIAGVFINVVAIRNQPSFNKTFRDFLNEVKGNAIAAFDNQDYPFDELVDKVVIKRDWNRTPLFDVYFFIDNIGITQLQIPGLKIKPYLLNKTNTQYDLMLGMAKMGEELGGVFKFATSRFRKETIQKLATEFTILLDALAENPDQPLSEFQLVQKTEREKSPAVSY